MKSDDKDKLNKCLEILDTTDLGLSMVWLWTWSTIRDIMNDTSSWTIKVTEDQIWNYLGEAVSAGQGFSLEYGADQHYEEVVEWMSNRDYIVDSMEEEDAD
jgi:hypothetical protein